MNAQEMSREGDRLCRLVEEALDDARLYIREAAEAERIYRRDKALAWVHCSGGTAKAKEAWVDGETADQRYARDLADGMRRASMQAVEARRQMVSLLQSVANTYRAEAEYTRTAPEFVGR